MNDTTTLAQQMVAAAPAATRNVNLSMEPKRGAGVGMARVAQFSLGQKDIRNGVPFLTNRENVS